MGEFVRLEIDEDRRVGTLRLDRPPMNPLSQQMWKEIVDVAREAEKHESVRALVVWGGPEIFAAGADIKEFPTWDRADARAATARLHDDLGYLERIPMVTIAAVNGLALGGGCELAMTCDFRFAAEDARFGQPEILLGLIPGAGGTQRLLRLVGVPRAKELIYGGQQIDAATALEWGLVDRVVPEDRLLDVAVDAAAGYARGPAALRQAKQAINEGMALTLDQGVRLESALFAACFETEDAQIGIRTFIDDGPGRAEFEGR